MSKIRDHRNVFDAGQYCVMGYPAKSKQEHKERVEHSAQALYVAPSKEKVYQHYKFDPKRFHLMEVKGKGRNMKLEKE